MKKGQRVDYQKEAFQHGMVKGGLSAAINHVRSWKQKQSKRDRMNVCRKKSKK